MEKRYFIHVFSVENKNEIYFSMLWGEKHNLIHFAVFKYRELSNFIPTVFFRFIYDI